MILTLVLYIFILFIGEVYINTNAFQANLKRYGRNHSSFEIQNAMQYKRFIWQSFLITSIIMSSWIFLISKSVYDFKEEEIIEKKLNLESARTITNTYGNFLYINTGEKYTSFIKNKDGGLKKIYFPDSTVIYERDIEKPYLTYDICNPGERIGYMLGAFKTQSNACSNLMRKNRKYNYKLYIPNGSIQLTTEIK